MSLKINPELQTVVAPLTTEEYAQLRDNIQRDGLLEPITIWAEQSGTILDGHNRHAICLELGIGFKTKALSFPNIEAAKLWILEHQVGRRNLTDDQRAIIWNDIREQRAAVSRAAAIVKAREAKANPGPVGDNASPTEPKPRTIAAVVAESKIPERVLRKAQKLKKTNPDLYERVRSGTVTLREASKPKKNDRKFAEKDYFARIGRGLAAAFSGTEPRLKELIAIKRDEWTPQADEGVQCIILNLKDVSKKADGYAKKLKAVLKKNRPTSAQRRAYEDCECEDANPCAACIDYEKRTEFWQPTL
jgi:ParB-like chromosome segregation protein Spo0J